MIFDATFSECRTWRYSLIRSWGDGNHAVFIGLNPSTADETTDDATIRRCVAFARGWGYGGLCMVNLFAYRATKPAEMMKASDPVGPDNDDYLIRLCADAGIVIACWGVHGAHRQRSEHVVDILQRQRIRLHALALTIAGEPRHPLYLSKSTSPFLWRTWNQFPEVKP